MKRNRLLWLFLGAAVAGLVAAQVARSPGSGAALVGLWAADTVLGPALRGPLTVARAPAGSGWVASLGGNVARADGGGDSLRLVFPGGSGELRGRLRAEGREIRGFWVQPAGPVMGVPYASPLTLRRVAPGRWQGRVVPIDERFRLFLTFLRNPDGSLGAVFRNPEQGIRLGAPRFSVTPAGDSLRFTAAPAGGRPVAFSAAHDAARRVITLRVAALGLTLRLTPRPDAAAPGSRPRDPSQPPYVYRVPPALPGGWPVAAAGAVGLDEAVLTRIVRRFAAQDPIADTAPTVHAFLVEHHGKLVLEEYFYGFDRDRPHDLRSASKTFTGIMIGAARARGLPLDTATPVYALFGGYSRFAHPNPRKAAITVADLLTHTSGLACDDNDDASPGNEGAMQSQTAQPDWYRYTLDLPLVNPPGAHYAYCSGGMNLAGGALARSSDAWLPALFDTLVARPLGLGRYYVNLMPTGQAYSGGGVYLRPRDFLEFGELYLRGGAWHGRQVVPRPWAERSVQPHVTTGPASADGLAWHLNTLRSGGRDYREYEANGNGGQFLIVLPDLDLSIVFTAGDYGRYGVWRHLRDDVVASEIIPAVGR